jgi:hypothetical protein
MHYFSTLFGKELYMFGTDLLSTIRGVNTVFTALGICHTGYVDRLLADSICHTGYVDRLLADSQQNQYDKYLLLHKQC